MRTCKTITKALIVALVIALSPLVASAQEAAPFDGRSMPAEVQEGTLMFSFTKAEWKVVIEWFAEQTGLSWRALDEKFPKGSFTLNDSQEYTPLEALDQLNYALRLQDPPYTIIRNRNQLILTEASKELPVELIPKVTAKDLDQRGDFEVLSCQFDLGVLNVQDVEADLKASISQKYFRHAKSLPALNSFFARGPGADLKNIRGTIESLTAAKTLTYKIYTLKHYDPEQFLMAARGPLKIPTDAYERPDGTLSVSVDPTSGRMFVNGTPVAHKAFREITELLDVAPTEGGAGLERVYLKSYPITTDTEMTKKVVETQLDGTTAVIGQNAITGAIILRGTEAHHKIAADTIATLAGESGSTKIVELQNASAVGILEQVAGLLNLTSTGDNPNAPRMLANTSQNYIMIHGTPQDIFKISGMIDQLDKAQGRDPNRIRTNARTIEMSPEKRDELLNTVQDRWPSTGRKNTLRIIMPDEKVQDKFENRRKMVVPKDSSTGVAFPFRRRVRTYEYPAINRIRTVVYQEIVERPAEATEAEPASETLGSRYVPPTEVQSVPGAEVSIKATPFGVLIESDDLDALDDLEDIFRSQAIEDGTDQGLTIFYLKYRKVTSVKAELEEMFGLASSSGGSDGDGGMLGGIVDNMAGDGAGDLLGGLGGLLGGSGSSSSSGAIELTGDVQFGLSVPLNLLYVSGATKSDLNYIQDAIDLFDQASAPQNPQLVGKAYSIPVNHRSPQGVFDQVSKLMADYIVGGQTAEGEKGGGGDNGASQMAKAMLRGMGGGGGGGQKDAAAAEETPKVRMSLDETTGQILVIGPEFIYQQILTLVEAIDRPDLSKPKSYEVLPGEFFSPGAMEIIRKMFGAKVTIAEAAAGSGSESEGGSQSSDGRTSQANQGQPAKPPQQPRQDQIRAEFERSLNNRGGGGRGANGGGQRGGGRAGGGGQRGGGGGQRGGGGGQRGGGGR